jgi:hypothetical protein
MQDRFHLSLDVAKLVEALGREAARTCGENLSRGLAPDGSTLPPLKAATVARRAQEGYGPGPRGVRSGRLARSFRSVPSGHSARVAAVEDEPGQLATVLGESARRGIRISPERLQAAMRGALRTKP